MENTIREAKQRLRGEVYAALERMTAAERAAASEQARAFLRRQVCWTTAQSVLFFAPLPGELDIWPLLTEALAAGKRVALPRFLRSSKTYEVCEILDPQTDLEAGHFGIREPKQACQGLASGRMDLILVPGVAFGARGHRLGRGKGYYDQLLAKWEGTTCGVAFDQQMATEIPVEPHDVRLDYVLTPTRWIDSGD
jgi:5-formyltetrahydrofolate cyclo-ligase